MDKFEKAKEVIKRKVSENKAKVEKLVAEQRTLRDMTFKQRKVMPYEQYVSNISKADSILKTCEDINKETAGLRIAMEILMSIERGELNDGKE